MSQDFQLFFVFFTLLLGGFLLLFSSFSFRIFDKITFLSYSFKQIYIRIHMKFIILHDITALCDSPTT